MKIFSRSRTCITRALLLLGLFFLAYLAYRSRGELQQAFQTASVPLLVVSILVLLTANVAVALLFAGMLHGSNENGVWRRIVGVFLAAQLAKYVPGRVWSLVAQVSALQSVTSPGRLVLVNIELTAVVVATTCGIGMALMLSRAHGVAIGLVSALMAFVLTAFVVRFGWVRRALGAGISRVWFMREYAIVEEIRSDSHGPSRLRVVALAAFWAMYLMGWWLLVQSLPQVASVGAGLVVACLSLSYIAGLASMLPAGLGAREAALVLLAPVSGIPFDLMALLAVTSRVALMLVDGIGSLIGFLMIRNWKEGRDV